MCEELGCDGVRPLSVVELYRHFEKRSESDLGNICIARDLAKKEGDFLSPSFDCPTGGIKEDAQGTFRGKRETSRVEGFEASGPK